jgi:hypothetical protein
MIRTTGFETFPYVGRIEWTLEGLGQVALIGLFEKPGWRWLASPPNSRSTLSGWAHDDVEAALQALAALGCDLGTAEKLLNDGYLSHQTETELERAAGAP